MSYGQRPEALDTRWIFRGYAILAGIAGFLTMVWGGLVFGTDIGEERWVKVTLIRVFGGILVGAACCAEAFARVENAAERRHALMWFTAGHGAVALVVLVQQTAVWGRGVGEGVAAGLITLVLIMLYLLGTIEGEPVPRALTTLFGGNKPTPVAALRSQYEQQIREAARQEERNRLARDLHESIKQQIFVIQTAAATAQARFESDREGSQAAIEQVRGASREAVAEMEAMLDQLRSVPLENAGLIEALKKQCEALGFRSGARVEFKLGVLPESEFLPPGAHQAMLRAAQEALANIGRHARAAHVALTLTTLQGRVEMRIVDDGSGFDPAASARGQGIANMRARAEELGGTFELESHPGRGTSVIFSLPYTTVEPAGAYRRKALVSGGICTILIGLAIWRWDLNFVTLSILAAIWTARYAVAWHRVREGAR